MFKVTGIEIDPTTYAPVIAGTFEFTMETFYDLQLLKSEFTGEIIIEALRLAIKQFKEE